MEGETASYKIGISVEPELPIAYAIYHPTMSDKFVFISGDLIRQKATKLSDL
jgi:hypothetical protein